MFGIDSPHTIVLLYIIYVGSKVHIHICSSSGLGDLISSLQTVKKPAKSDCIALHFHNSILLTRSGCFPVPRSIGENYWRKTDGPAVLPSSAIRRVFMDRPIYLVETAGLVFILLSSPSNSNKLSSTYFLRIKVIRGTNLRNKLPSDRPTGMGFRTVQRKPVDSPSGGVTCLASR